MPVNKNISARKSPIVRIEGLGRSSLQCKVIANVFETSLILFRKDMWYAFQCMDTLRVQLENKPPSEQQSVERMMETNTESCILFVNKEQEQKMVNNTACFRENFRTLEMMIDGQVNQIPSVKFKDLYNGNMEHHIPDNRQLTENKTQRQEPISIRIYIRKAVNRKCVLPRLRRQDINMSKPLDGVEHLHYPVAESSPNSSAQVISGQLTRLERLESNSSLTSTRHGEYQPYIGASRPINDSNHTTNKPKYPEYADYAKRKASFSDWRHRNPTPTEFCNAGFFFTKEGDLVRCFQCGIGLKDFSAGDDPLLEHVRYSGQCAFLTGSLDPDTLERLKAQYLPDDSHAHRGVRNNEILSSHYQEYRHPELRKLGDRIETFRNWPSTHGLTPSQLAEAGLFYTGYDDLVRCFACDGGLRRWEPDDDPWIEHCRWFPTCRFAREQKGDEYIARVQAMVEYQDQEGGASGGQDASNAMQKLTLSSPQVKSVLDEHRAAVVDMMGFDEQDFNDAVMELKMRDGTTKVEEIIEMIEIIQERKREENTDVIKEENPFELNKKLKGFLVCSRCKVNEANALFLPCAHHNTCMTCAQSLSECPSCKRHIKEKIKTYMG